MEKSPIENHPLQKKVWLDKSRFKVIVAGRRFGKTWYAAERLLFKSCKPKSCVCYVAPTRQQAFEILWDHILKRCHELKWRIKVNVSNLTIKRMNGTQIELKSAEKPDRFRGRWFDYIALDEFAEYRKKEIWTQAIRPTLSDTRGEADFIFTPKGFGNSYDLYQNAKTEEDWNCYQFKTIDSPFFQTEEGKQEIEDAKKHLSEKDFRQEYEACFEAYQGRIYSSFSRDKCNTDYEYNPNNGVVYVGQDFNRSPMASGLFQKVGGTLYQFSEIFISVGNTKQTCEEIQRLFPNKKIIVRPDATGNRKTSNSSLSDFDIIRSFGYHIESSSINPRRVDRWCSVNRAFEKGLIKVNVKNCPQTVKDRETLIYKEGSCEPDLKDPMLGHMSDACDYCIAREFPLIKQSPVQISTYA